MLHTFFQALDSDESGWLNYGALRDGLLKIKAFSPPIRLTEEEFDAITQHGALCNRNQEIDWQLWEVIMRRQMNQFVHRQLAASIPTVMADDQHLGILMFATRMILDRCADQEDEDAFVHKEACTPRAAGGLAGGGGSSRCLARKDGMAQQVSTPTQVRKAADMLKRGLNKGSRRHLGRGLLGDEPACDASPGTLGTPSNVSQGSASANLGQQDRMCGALDRMTESIRANTLAVVALEARVAALEGRGGWADETAGKEVRQATSVLAAV